MWATADDTPEVLPAETVFDRALRRPCHRCGRPAAYRVGLVDDVDAIPAVDWSEVLRPCEAHLAEAVAALCSAVASVHRDGHRSFRRPVLHGVYVYPVSADA